MSLQYGQLTSWLTYLIWFGTGPDDNKPSTHYHELALHFPKSYWTFRHITKIFKLAWQRKRKRKYTVFLYSLPYMTKFSFKHCDIISHRQVNEIILLPCFDANMWMTVSFCQILRIEYAIILKIGSKLFNIDRLNKLCWTEIIDISVFLGCVRYIKD